MITPPGFSSGVVPPPPEWWTSGHGDDGRPQAGCMLLLNQPDGHGDDERPPGWLAINLKSSPKNPLKHG